MKARGRVSSTTDWDPMKDDFNDSAYDAQYQDNDTSSRSMQSVALNHRRLYITNIPTALNEQGLRTIFEKYGQLEHAFLSRDPTKKYGLVTYETAGEARIAMMKLNRTEPLNLNINLAHAKGDKERTHKETNDSSSHISSSKERRPRNQEENMNQEEEEMDSPMVIDHTLHMELQKIKMDKLRLQEEQLKCREKMMLMQLQQRTSSNQAPAAVSSRRLLPDGRIIVQERAPEPDANFTAGAGDSLNIPGLQRESERACVVCGARADLFCARCAVTPYCNEQCQQKDWVRRHKAVCHNLIRLNSGRSASPVDPVDVNSNAPVPSPPAPLRRPRSPNAGRGAPQRNGMPSGNKDLKSKFVPPGHHPPPQRLPRGPARPEQTQNTNDNEEWGPSDRNNQQKPAPKSRVDITNIKNEPPRPKHDMNNRFDKPKPRIEIPQAKVETQQPKIETPQPKIETPQPKVETPQPKPEFSRPKFETSQPKAETSQPKVEAPQPKVEPPKVNNRMGANFATEARVEIKPRTPQIDFVPAQFLIEKLPIGESFLLSVEHLASTCGSKQKGFVCLAMHAEYQAAYNDLLSDIYDGENAIVPKPGATFAYLEPDEGWYRARCLSANKCALLDSGRVADMTAQTQCRALAAKYADIPEFCCVLDGNAEIGMSLKCTVLMKSAEGYNVSIDDVAQDTYLGVGLVARWLPEVDSPAPVKPVSVQARLNQASVESPSSPVKTQAIPDAKPVASAKPQPTGPRPVPSVVRPEVVNNGKYLLLHVTSLSHACVRACDAETTAEFESVIQDTALYGMQNAKPLPNPPSQGDVVLCHYEDVHYRALVTRTKASENRYKVQYAEYGNEEIVSLEKLFVCPPELSLTSRPARASVIALSTAKHTLTPEATEYVDTLTKSEAELIATIPTGEKSVPSGSLVVLSIAKNKENVNKKLEAMCTPEWKKLEDAGGDVIESDVVLYTSMNTLPLPTDREFVLEVTDFTFLENGNLSGFERGQKIPEQVFGPLTDKINEYCSSSLCNEPYLPMVEELCLAKLEPYPQWFRAVVAEHKPGEATASILYIDYGTVASVPVSDLRKCMPEFARLPAVAATADIKDWPESLTQQQLAQALHFLQIEEVTMRGKLSVARCRRADDDNYIVEVPELIAAINK